MAKNLDLSDYLASLTDPVRDLGIELRAVLDAALPGATARIWHGQPVWMNDKKPLAGFKAYRDFVTFMIWHGEPIADPTGRLQVGAHMATVKVRTSTDIDRQAFTSWLKAAHAP